MLRKLIKLCKLLKSSDGLKCDKWKLSTFVRPLDSTNYQDREFIRAYHLQNLDKIDDDENELFNHHIWSITARLITGL